MTGESARVGFAEAVRLAAQPENLPLVYHCSAGKDRTGWLTVILLTALGVDEAAIRADYLRNNELTDSLRAVIIEAMRRRQPELDVDAVLPVLEVRADISTPVTTRSPGARLVRRVPAGRVGVDRRYLSALRAQLLE